MRIKKNDNVMVISGKDKGKTGKITRAFPRLDQVIVDGVNVKKKHQKARRGNQKGQIVEFAAPFHVSNVMIIDPKLKKPTRIGYITDGDKKIRVTKKSGTRLSD